MKTRNVLIAVFILASSAIYAQNAAENSSAEFKPKLLGIGIITSVLNTDDIYQDYPMEVCNKVIITITPIKNLRIQPVLGYFATKEHSDDIGEDLKTSNLTFGAGIYGMWQKGNTNFYFGPKLISTIYKNDYVDMISNPNPPYTYLKEKATNTFSTFSYGLFVGGEYFIGSHFSVGAELGVMNSKIDFESTETTFEKYTANKFMTRTDLLVRFYF